MQQSLKEYCADALSKGYGKDELRAMLIKYNYPPMDVDAALAATPHKHHTKFFLFSIIAICIVVVGVFAAFTLFNPAPVTYNDFAAPSPQFPAPVSLRGQQASVPQAPGSLNDQPALPSEQGLSQDESAINDDLGSVDVGSVDLGDGFGDFSDFPS